MNFKTEIKNKGLKVSWIAEKIDENYSSLRVWISDQTKMPERVELKLKKFLK